MKNSELDNMHHVTIQVADIQQSLQWYTSSFRCEVLLQEMTFAVVQFANIKLELVLPSQQTPHLAFQKPNAAEYGELRQQLDGESSASVADPTGNVVEIVLSSTCHKE